MRGAVALPAVAVGKVGLPAELVVVFLCGDGELHVEAVGNTGPPAESTVLLFGSVAEEPIVASFWGEVAPPAQVAPDQLVFGTFGGSCLC